MFLAYCYWTSLEALPIFLNEREIFQREFSRGAYRGISYALASTFVYFPFLFAIAITFTSISYWLVGFPNDVNIYFFQVLMSFVALIVGHSFSTMISVLTPDPMTGLHTSYIIHIIYLY